MDSRSSGFRGKIEALLELVLQAVRAGASWRSAMMRIDGSYYQEQVKMAAKKYVKEHRKDTVFNIEGYDKYLAVTKGAD